MSFNFTKITFSIYFFIIYFEIVGIILGVIIIFLITITRSENDNFSKPKPVMAGGFLIGFFSLGSLLMDIVKGHPAFFGMGEIKTIQWAATAEHFESRLAKTNLKALIDQNNLVNEAASKAFLAYKAKYQEIDILPNRFTSNSIIFYPSSKLSLMPYVAKGGDVLFFEDQKLIVTELKYRHVEFKSSKRALDYIDTQLIDKYKKNLKPCSMLVDCVTESIAKNLLNCIKHGGNGEDFIFEDQDELKNISIQELEKFPTKSQFKHIIVSDKSFFYEPSLDSHKKFNETCAEFLKNTEFMKNYNDNIKNVIIAKLQTGEFKVNKFVEDDIAFLKNLDYEKPEN